MTAEEVTAEVVTDVQVVMDRGYTGEFVRDCVTSVTTTLVLEDPIMKTVEEFHLRLLARLKAMYE